jgi:hypothetical protein
VARLKTLALPSDFPLTLRADMKLTLRADLPLAFRTGFPFGLRADFPPKLCADFPLTLMLPIEVAVRLRIPFNSAWNCVSHVTDFFFEFLLRNSNTSPDAEIHRHGAPCRKH